MTIRKNSYREILDNLYAGLYFVDENRIIQYWNKAAESISGFKAAEVIGRPCSDNILTHVDSDGHNLCKGVCPLANAIIDREARTAEVFMHHKDGHRVPVRVRASVLTNAKGIAVGGVELFIDISSSESIELRIKELEEMAFIDNLTRLANRNRIESEMIMRFEEQKRIGLCSGILFIDIDHFKKFNDTYGHDVGDRVLKFVANTLLMNSRPFDIFGRWGGEEFIGIIRHVDHEQLERLGSRLRILVENSYIIEDGDKLHVTISIGATLFQDGESVDTLLKRADTLLYESKRRGRNCVTMG